MKASTERNIMRWLHILLSIPIVGYIYGPVASIPQSAMVVRLVIFPIVVLSGFWMWKGHVVKKWVKSKSN
jgi:thiosulfate reductase cytochrome b subunit